MADEVVPAQPAAVNNEDWLGIGRDDLEVVAPAVPPATPAPEVAVVSPEAAAQAAPPVPAAEAAPVVEPVADPVKAVFQQNKELAEAMQGMATENARLLKAMADRESRETAPSAEELEAQAEIERQQLLADPAKVLTARENKLREQLAQDAEKAARTSLAKSLGYDDPRDMDIAVASANGVKRLTADKAQFPLMGDDAFRAEMAKPENLTAVFKQFPKESDPAEILRKPEAWALMYTRTALARATKTPVVAAPAAPAPKSGDEPITPVSTAPAAVAAGVLTNTKSALELEWDALASSDSPVLK